MTEQSSTRDRTLPSDDRHVLLDDDPFQGVAAPGKQPTLTTGGQPAFFSCWDIHAYYGESYIVQGVSFDIREGEIVALLGRNGAGKTSTLRAIARLDSPELKHGEIWLDREALHKMKSHQASRNGIGLVPEDRRIIRGLSVEENLELAQIAPPRDGRSSASTTSFPGSASADGKRGQRFRAASSRCWRSAARWPATSSCCSSTSPTRALRR